MENKIENLMLYRDTIQNLYNDGYCKGIISKKKIRLLVGILSSKIKEEKNKVLEKSDK